MEPGNIDIITNGLVPDQYGSRLSGETQKPLELDRSRTKENCSGNSRRLAIYTDRADIYNNARFRLPHGTWGHHLCRCDLLRLR